MNMERPLSRVANDTLLAVLASNVTSGTLELRLPGGERYRFGRGEPHALWHVHDRSVLTRVFRNPELEMGETYVEGRWDAGESDPAALLTVLMRNLAHLRRPHGLARVAQSLTQALSGRNGVRRSYENASFHYDLDASLFRLFLDEDLQYSCAYFSRPDMTLEEAQRAKLALLRRKLGIRPGDRVLDIGCGWGGLALYLAERDQVTVTGLTLSREQLEVARHRALDRGLANRVRFLLRDYREHEGSYDRIVSVGMFEHVGQPRYDAFFDALRTFLRPGGLALLHTIGRTSPPAETSEWIRRHIFPGSHLPALSEIAAAVERARLATTDVEVLRLHYARTLSCWSRRFRVHRAEIRERLGERFCRTWEFYLASSEASFRVGDLVVFQVQLAKDPFAAPLTRDYLFEERDPRPDLARAVALPVSRRLAAGARPRRRKGREPRASAARNR